MKSLKYYLMALAGIAMLNACSDDDPVPGNPTMDFQAEPSSALFGDSLPLQSRHRTQMYPFPR